MNKYRLPADAYDRKFDVFKTKTIEEIHYNLVGEKAKEIIDVEESRLKEIEIKK